MDDLRRLTVRVLLTVLVITVIGKYVDAWFFQNIIDPIPIITLIGGMVSGLFAPELLRARVHREDDKTGPSEKEGGGNE